MDVQNVASRADKRKFERNEALEEAGMNIIIHAARLIQAKSGISAGDIVNGMKLANVLHQALMYLRERAYDNTTRIIGYLESEHKVGSLNLKLSQWADFVEKVVILHGEPVTPKADWIIGALLTLTYSTCFEERLKELRLGHTEIVIKPARAGLPETKRDISSFGLNPKHEVLLSGIRVTPLKRSVIALSLGPLTQIYCFRYSDQLFRFHVKWESLLLSTLAHLPFKIPLIKLLKTCSPAEFSVLLPLIGDILLMTGSRQAQKLALPIGALTGYMTPAEKSAMVNEYDAINTWTKGASAPPYTYQSRHIAIEGKDGVIAYNEFMKGNSVTWEEETSEPPEKKAKTVGAEKMDSEEASSTKEVTATAGTKKYVPKVVKSEAKPTFYDVKGAGQIIVMCVFDTYKEDLGLQRWMCGETEQWLRRNEMDDLSELSKAEEKLVTVTPKIVKRYCIPSSTYPSTITYQSMNFYRSGQVCARPAFGGRRTYQDVSQLLAYLDKSIIREGVSEGRFGPMREMLLSFREQLRDECNEKSSRLAWENAKWFTIEGMKVDETSAQPILADAEPFLAPRNNLAYSEHRSA